MSDGSENLKHRKGSNLSSSTKSREEEEKFLHRLLSRSKTKNNRQNRNNQNLLDNDDDEESDLEDLPYGGRVYLPRRHKPDSWSCIAFQVFLIFVVIGLIYYAYYYYEHMHIHALKAYAHMGFDSAQHELGNRYLHGVGVDKHEETAMEWFKKAADQGHPHSSYNLAIGHLKGLKSPINQSEAKRLIQHAAENNVHEAVLTWNNICNRGECD